MSLGILLAVSLPIAPRSKKVEKKLIKKEVKNESELFQRF